MSWDAVIFDFEDTLVDISRGRPAASGPVYYSGARGVPPVTDRAGRPVVEALTLLGEAGIPVAVITSSPEAAMRRWFQEHQFALPVAIIGFHDTVLHRPSPHPLLEALSQIGLPASKRVLSVGDSADDITAAHRAGLTAGTVREFCPATDPPDVFLPFVESFFDDERQFSMVGDLERGGPKVSLQLELPGHVCRTGGTVTSRPRNRFTNLLSGARDGNWPQELVDLGVSLVDHAVGADREGVVLTWVPNHQGRPDVLKALMLRLKDETGLTVSPLLRFSNDPGEQAARDRGSRAAGMTNTMEARGKVNLSGRTILVVDDYRATGATLAEAARALRDAGASRVVGVALGQEVHRADAPRATYGPLLIRPLVEAAAADASADDEAEVEAWPTLTDPVDAESNTEVVSPPDVGTVRPRRAPPPPVRRPQRPAAAAGDVAGSIKQKYPRAYQRWTPEEDALLTRLFRQGKDLATMCAALGRQPKSVETRIRRIEVDIDEADFVDDGSGEFPKVAPSDAPSATPPEAGEDADAQEPAGDGSSEMGAGQG